MGFTLGPTFANICVCHYEDIWLRDCPSECAPALNLRYVDDTFLLLRQKRQAGPGTSFFSFYGKKFKTNSVLSLLNKAYAICSNHHLIHNEFDFLKTLFIENGFEIFFC